MEIKIGYLPYMDKPPLIVKVMSLKDAVALVRADLSGANLSGAKNADLPIAQVSIVPDTGSFVGWKKCISNVLVKVLIPESAKRSNASGRKCRAEFVEVLEVIGAREGISSFDRKTRYRPSSIVRCDKWNEDRFVECGGGIHFFITRKEAENYNV